MTLEERSKFSNKFCASLERISEGKLINSTTDYEIEVEYSGEFPQKLMEELSALNVEFSEKGPGKYSRFIQKFKEQI